MPSYRDFEKLEKPQTIVDVQEELEEQEEKHIEQKHFPKVNLFFSFDIVNSTKFKSVTGNWHYIIRQLLENIREKISTATAFNECNLWRVIGDEMVFVMEIYNKEELVSAVDGIFDVTQEVANSLKKGKFFDDIVGQNIKKDAIRVLKSQHPLSIKAAAWVALVDENIEYPYECIKFDYLANCNDKVMTEYMGMDIDTGFRVKEYTEDRRLAISYELAMLLMKENNDNVNFLHIMDYVRLKGVWNDGLYPIIWYYNEEKCKRVFESEEGETKSNSFKNSFRYDEANSGSLARKIYDREREDYNDENKLESSMYDTHIALNKIMRDMCLEEKIDKFVEVLEATVRVATPKSYSPNIEFHCAVVCMDVKKQEVMITHRGDNHDTIKDKWEFGCAKLKGDEYLIETVEAYYKDTYGIEIKLICDDKRKQKLPIPIAVYEFEGKDSIKKGAIFIARVVRRVESKDFRGEKEHDEIKWIKQKDIKTYSKKAVDDFENTLDKVYSNFNEYFMED